MNRSNTRLIILGSLFVLALLAACTSPTNPSPTGSTGGGPAATSNPVPFVGDTSPNEPTPSFAVEASASTEVDAGGIPVGFTEEGRPFRGDIGAPVVIEAFSDYQCPYCGRFTKETLPGLLENQVANGEVVLVFYDFPLNSIHPQAASAANAARCAGESGAAAYWAMHDRLFEDIQEWSNSNANEVFAGYAQELGFAGEAFDTCLAEDRYGEAVEADLAIGQSRGVNSTPSFFLNDQPVIGAYPLDYFNQAIAAVQEGESIAVEEPEPRDPSVAPTPATIVEDDSAFELGDKDAPVTIVEYTDYQCPYCARHAGETLPRMVAEMVETGQIRYVIKDFPIDAIHPEARAAAAAARCAGEQDAYWDMHDRLFSSQSQWGDQGAAASETFVTLATGLGLDAAEFSSCLASGRYDGVIQDNLDEGSSLGVNGTPAFFINGFPVSGAQPYELFEYAVALAAAGTLADAYVAPVAEPTPAAPAGPVEVDSSNGFSIGDPDAPVVIVEFTDYQCPFCSRHFSQTLPQIKANYIDTGKVRYVIMDFPLTSIHPQAQLAAEAARCAGDQDAYLEMHDTLFERMDEWGGRSDAAEVFAEYAGALGLDTDLFAACLESGQHTASVLADLENGSNLGVSGTPAFFLNGYFLSGAQPYEVFQQEIERLLAGER